MAPGRARRPRRPARACSFPVQLGGAAGTLAAAHRARRRLPTPPQFARWPTDAAGILGLDHAPPWHTSRAPFTRYADALVRATDAMGHIANDVLLLARPEIGELAEPAGRGPRRILDDAAEGQPGALGADPPGRPGRPRPRGPAAPRRGRRAVDERPDGGWHTEWSTLATLLAAHADRRARRPPSCSTGCTSTPAGWRPWSSNSPRHCSPSSAASARCSDRPSAPRDADFDPGHYLGATGAVIDQILARARADQETS